MSHCAIIMSHLYSFLLRYSTTAGLIRAFPSRLWLPRPVITCKYDGDLFLEAKSSVIIKNLKIILKYPFIIPARITMPNHNIKISHSTIILGYKIWNDSSPLPSSPSLSSSSLPTFLPSALKWTEWSCSNLHFFHQERILRPRWLH